MQITCEHCGCAIDIEKDKTCPNCKAPYKNNKEYKHYKETMKNFDMREREASIRTKEIANDLMDGTKKTASISFIVFIIIFISVVALIVTQVINQNKIRDEIFNSDFTNTDKTKEKEEEKDTPITISINETAEMKKYNIICDEVREYKYAWHEKGEYRKAPTKYYAFHFVIKNKTEERLTTTNFKVSYKDDKGNEGILANKVTFPNDDEKPLMLNSYVEGNYSISGYVFYEIPNYVKEVQIHYNDTVNVNVTLK